MNEKLHEIRICQNSTCGFRFPLNPTEKRITHCPKCGADTKTAVFPYRSFLIENQAPYNGKKLELHAVLDNIRSAFNVGAMFRTADGVGFESLYLCGITPTPQHPKVGKTALGAEKAIRWQHSWDTLDTVQSLKKNGYQIWALEGGFTSESIFEKVDAVYDERPLALVVGNEVSGVDPAIVSICDVCVYIPMLGMKESLNVAVAFGITAYTLRYRGENHA